MGDKIVISGTGRCGTTFLMILFTLLQYNTGFTPGNYDNHIFANCNSGLENLDIARMATQYEVVKHPELTDHPDLLDKFLEKYTIRQMIIPIRNYEDAAESRAKLGGVNGGDGSIAGGLWKANNKEEQLDFYRYKMSNYLVSMVRHDIPTIFLDFNQMIRDPHYLYSKLHTLCEGIDFETFQIAYNEATRHQQKQCFPRA